MSEEKKRKLKEYQINDGEANKNSLNLTKKIRGYIHTKLLNLLIICLIFLYVFSYFHNIY